jgi:hypothetical protein
VWAYSGRDEQAVYKFLDLLDKDRCEQIQLISCDMADGTAIPIAQRCPGSEICLGPFHVTTLSTDASDAVRREVCNDTREAGQPGLAHALKGAQFALRMNPERLAKRHQQKLAGGHEINKDLHRAYRIAQQPPMIHRVPCEQALDLLDAWLEWARRRPLAPFVTLAKTVTKHRPRIETALRHSRFSPSAGSAGDYPVRLRQDPRFTQELHNFRGSEGDRHALPGQPLSVRQLAAHLLWRVPTVFRRQSSPSLPAVLAGGTLRRVRPNLEGP